MRCVDEREGRKSQYFVDLMNRPIGRSFTSTDGDDAIQEGICFRRCFESRHRSKVVAGGINDLSTAEGGDYVGRAMAHALKRHVNRRMVVCLQRDAQVQFENTVGALQQPVTSARQNLPAKSRAFEVAANDRHDAANAVGHRTQLLWRRTEAGFSPPWCSL